MTRIFTTRLPDEIIEKVREIAEKEHLDNSTVVRRLLINAIKEWQTKYVLEKLNSHKISIGKAAELLKIDLWDMMDLVKEHNINWTGFDDDDLERMKKILKAK